MQRATVLPSDYSARLVTENRLLTTVVEFMLEGLRCNDPVIAIATDAQRADIVDRLSIAIDVDRAQRAGELTFIDTPSLVRLILVNGAPDAARFACHVGGMIDVALRGSSKIVRLYSGIVDWMFARSEPDAALEIEQLLFSLARTHRFSLLCAHAMGTLYKQTDKPRIARTEPRPAATVERVVTAREAAVLRETASGHSNKDIANALHISVRTVEAHKANAMRKLGLSDRAGVIRWALLNGCLAPETNAPN